jgi:hypothetical protein
MMQHHPVPVNRCRWWAGTSCATCAMPAAPSGACRSCWQTRATSLCTAPSSTSAACAATRTSGTRIPFDMTPCQVFSLRGATVDLCRRILRACQEEVTGQMPYCKSGTEFFFVWLATSCFLEHAHSGWHAVLRAYLFAFLGTKIGRRFCLHESVFPCSVLVGTRMQARVISESRGIEVHENFLYDDDRKAFRENKISLDFLLQWMGGLILPVAHRVKRQERYWQLGILKNF